MLGETDLLVGALVAGERMESMMAPPSPSRRRARARDRRGGRNAAAHGARDGARGDPRRGARAPARGRRGLASIPPARPCTRSRASTRRRSTLLEAQGRPVRRWPARHHYFGGVSCVGRGRRRRRSAAQRGGDRAVGIGPPCELRRAASRPASPRRHARSARRAPPRRRTPPRRAAAATARRRAACRTGRRRSRAGTARSGARCRRSAGSCRSRRPRGARAPRPA